MDLPGFVAFVAEVKALRAAQRAYFRDRTQDALEESKRRERLVDSIIAHYEEPPGLFGRDDDDDDEGFLDDGPEPETMDLGPCCACGAVGPSVRNLLMLDQLAPVPGTGWGCLQCGLPSDGASAVVCDDCVDSGRSPEWAIDGFPAGKGRIPIAQLTGRHEHRMDLHPEARP